MPTVAELEKRIDRQDERIDSIESSQSNMSEKMIRLDEKMNSFNSELKHMSDSVVEIKSDVKKLIQEPANKWNQLGTLIIGTIVSLVLGFMAAQLFN